MKRIGQKLSSRASRRPQGGFTLIEFMIVVILLAVVAAVAVPGFQALVENS
ncbi:prepilin-type N-terminal cleavage/methylation domain-containing protein, partial [Haloferax sp. KTX1]|uniref:prepilin-type N-terminal cleavage/methylation domain-containing protein n=1 Tax=Haloferax sp. KTX1 TaxID=2600597 RepID=UPI0011DC9BED